MTHFANLQTILSKSDDNQKSTAPETPLSAPPFDQLRLNQAARPPQKLPALFDSRERCLGDPARLFAGAIYAYRKTNGRERVKFEWLDVLDGLKPYGLRGRIAGINSYLNRSTDIGIVAGLGRHLPWIGALKIFHNAGSEHTALAKYLSLRKIGVCAQRLRLVWIEDRRRQSNRVVLAAAFAGHNYILDNLRRDIASDDTFEDVRPYCSTSPTRFSLHWNGRDKQGWEKSLKQLYQGAMIKTH